MTLPPREGVGQLPEPRRLARLHEGFAFIEDRSTEIPVEQVKRGMNGSLSALRNAVFGLHGCHSKWVGSFPVILIHEGETAWDGRVQAFDLIGHSEAPRAYVWEEPPEQEGGRPQIFAVLEAGPVKNAVDAVLTSIAQRKREKGA